MNWFGVGVGVLLITWTVLHQMGRRRKLPPGPFPFPIVGNMLHLGRRPYESFARLSKKYGPLMSIHLGSFYAVVVSSPEMAKEILQKHGQVFSGRPVTVAVHTFDHNKISMALMPAGEKWREMRKMCNEQMFSRKTLEASQGLRKQHMRNLLEYVQRCSDGAREVNIREAALVMTVNLMSATLFSSAATEFESAECRGLSTSIEGVASIVGMANLADFFPVLKPFDLQGIQRKAANSFTKLLAILEAQLKRRQELRKADPHAARKDDFLDVLIDTMEGDEHFSSDHLTHLMLDMLAGGTEPNITTIEWIMATLVANPDKMAKLKQELKSALGESQIVEESDIDKLPYLQAVVKEVMRYHPPGPFLLPRRAESDQEVKGLMIPKGTQVIINVWAIGRDPSIWKNPDSFEPERFLGQKTDFKGNDFELIPFGAGRRMCPGVPLANRIVHTTTAALVHNFDWKWEGAASMADQQEELCGVVLRRAAPLKLIPFKS
nr:cytochrome P450 [Isodon lophanthoides var. gerardianus]